MKDYKVTYRLSPEEWEEDITWKGLRLAFIWGAKERNYDMFLHANLYQEQIDFYDINNQDVARIANKAFYGTMDEYQELKTILGY